MKSRFTFALFGILILLFVSQSFGARRDAVVKIVCTSSDGSQISGSGVCVDKGGVILTASHVVNKGSCRVFFKNRIFSARPILIPLKEGVAVIKVNVQEELPFLEIAQSQPHVGDSVWVLGFPEGEWSSYQTSITSDQLFFADDPTTQLIGVFDPVLFGTSGGPLVTKKWKVTGIASVSGKIPPQMHRDRRPRDSVFVSGTALDQTGGMFLALRHVLEALQAYRSTISTHFVDTLKKPILYAFTTVNCPACFSFKQDQISGKFAAYDVRIIQHGTSGWRSTIAEVQRTVRQPIPGAVPFFWIKGSRRIIQQQRYNVPGLLEILAAIVKGLGGLISNPAADPLRPWSEPEMPEPLLESSPAPKEADTTAEEPDWSQVEIVILGAKQDVGGIRGTIRSLGLKLAVGPLERNLHDLTNGKIGMHVVGQRTMPNRFEAVSIAARVMPSPFHVIVLVDKQPLGLKGLIAGIVERKIRGELGEKVPVEIIFARAHSKDYQSIKQALLTEEAEKYARKNSDGAEQQSVESPVIDTKHLAREVATLLLPKIKETLPSPIQDALKHLVPKQNKENNGPSPTEHGLVGGISLLVAERIRRAFQRRKEAKAS